MELVTLPGGRPPRLLTRLIAEQDAVLFAARPATAIGLVTRREARGLIPFFERAYDAMRATVGETPSPFVTTYLGRQSPSAFDALIVRPAGNPARGSAVIFLHGFSGNFAYQCWLVGRAAARAGLVTICPSTSWQGAWWQPEGQAIRAVTMEYLRREGYGPVYLAGLSNGGIGISRLMAELEADIAGLIFISGVMPSAITADRPILLIHGREDERMPVSLAREAAAAAGESATLVELTGNHFVLAKESAAVSEAIAAWLAEQEQ
jgi:pimeloyl-ACP methyl ester carboxylesterase